MRTVSDQRACAGFDHCSSKFSCVATLLTQKNFILIGDHRKGITFSAELIKKNHQITLGANFSDQFGGCFDFQHVVIHGVMRKRDHTYLDPFDGANNITAFETRMLNTRRIQMPLRIGETRWTVILCVIIRNRQNMKIRFFQNLSGFDRIVKRVGTTRHIRFAWRVGICDGAFQIT